MPIATHLIKIKGKIGHWSDDDIKKYIDEKIMNKIDSSFHATLEKFEVKDNHAEVWVYIHAFPSEISHDVIEKWLKDHIKEADISVTGFEIVEVANLCFLRCTSSKRLK